MPINNTDNNCSEKICIQGKKVFDACMKQTTLQQITVSVTDPTPCQSDRAAQVCKLQKQHDHGRS